MIGDGESAGCDLSRDGHHDFASWYCHGWCHHYQQVPGQVDEPWVLDVNGKRLVVDATYGPDTTSSDRAELDSVVASLRFVTP